MESGFDKPYATETFVAVLRKSGKRVGVLGYPGFDAKTENRTADFAVAYDNSPVKPQFLALGGVEPLSFAIESRVNLGTKHPATATRDPKSNKVTVDFGASGRHQVGTTAWTDVAFEEAGVRQHVSMRVFVKPENSAPSAPPASWAPSSFLYVSATTRNNASPEAFRKELDAKGVIFSAGKNYRVRSEFGDEAFLRTMEHRLSFFESAGLEMLMRDDADAFFLTSKTSMFWGTNTLATRVLTPFVPPILRKSTRRWAVCSPSFPSQQTSLLLETTGCRPCSMNLPQAPFFQQRRVADSL